MNDLSESVKRADVLRKEFETLTGDLYRTAYDERFEKLSPEERIALQTPDDKKTERQFMVAVTARQKVEPSPTDVAKLLPPDKRVDGLQLAVRVEEEELYRQHVDNYRNQVNYNYWETRARAEQSDLAIAAHQTLYDAEKLLSDAELDEALKKYEESWVHWKNLFDTYPILMVDEGGDEVLDAIRRYARALDKELGDEFILMPFVKLRREYDQNGGDIQTLLEMSRASAMKAKAAEEAAEKAANESPEPNAPPATPTTPEPAPTADTPAPPADAKPEAAMKPASESAAPAAETPDSGEPPAPPAGDGSGT